MKQRVQNRWQRLFLLSTLMISFSPAFAAKIVGLVPVRNEALIIEQCLKALACYTDAIIVLDDASEDETVAIVKSLAHECNVEKIIEKKIWYRDEPGDRNKLLQAGRAIGGTHFVVIDADEMFTAPCLENNFLRNKILEMKPGEVLEFALLELWKDLRQCVKKVEIKELIFCDNGIGFYQSDFIHTWRIPDKLFTWKVNRIKPYLSYGLLHFKSVNWTNRLIRQAWYRCIELIRHPQEIKRIKYYYRDDENEKNFQIMACPDSWFSGYSFIDFSVYQQPESWHKQQILQWFEQYGHELFADLDIWNIDWEK